MKKRVTLTSLVILTVMVLTVLSGCNQGTTQTTPTTAPGSSESAGQTQTKTDDKPDTISALLPPISNQFIERLDAVEAAFHTKHPNLTLSIEAASWDDRIEKLDTLVNAGSPPDIAFLGSEMVPKYVDMGVAMDISKYATQEMISDFSPAALEYLKNGSGLFGFPAYMEIHGIGGNKEYMEAIGLDWKSIQTKGWTFEEFAKAVKAGAGVKGKNSTSSYGLVFATAGTTTKNYIEIFSKNAGIKMDFNEDLKYAYTSKKFLKVLEGVSQLIDSGANFNATSGERWNMFLTGQTVFTGKGLATFENMAKANNKKIEANDGSAVAGSVPVEYVVMPVPTTDGAKPAYYAVVDGYITFRGKTAPSDEHMTNVVKAAYYLASGENAAQINADLFAVNITKSGQAAQSKYPVERDADNLACIEYLMANAAPARPDIPSELMAKATKIMDEVIIPKFQALIVKEITPQQMYDAVYNEAVAVFGEDGIVKD